MDLFSVILFFMTMRFGALQDICTSDKYRKINHVAQKDISFDDVISTTSIRSRTMCADHCNKEKGCLSFSYNGVNKTCQTYSQILIEGTTASVTSSAMYFSKVPGVYDFTTSGGSRIEDFYETEVDGGPWVVIQRRTRGDVDFYRNWTDYKNGFGDLREDFWIGNDNLHLLTNSLNVLRVDLEAMNGTQKFVVYSTFRVANETENYRLTVDGFSGDIEDSLSYHSGSDFSTLDRDNDNNEGNCARDYRGAWWYNSCCSSQLNGDITAMIWTGFYQLIKSKMMIR